MSRSYGVGFFKCVERRRYARTKQIYDSNPDIQLDKRDLNYHLIEPQQKYYAEIQGRIESAGCKVRKDSIKFIDTLIIASPAFFESHSPQQAKEYFKAALDFLKQEVRGENIFSAVVHMDERNPHMHICFVPLTKDKRLSAKDIIGNHAKLISWQDKFHEHMSTQFPVLEREEPAVETRRKHIPSRLFKQANRLTEEMTVIKQEIESIGTFNVGKKKEKVLGMLKKWYQSKNSFDAQVQSLKLNIENLQYNDSLFREQTQQKSHQLNQTKIAYRNLQIQYNDLMKLVNEIPQEIMDELQRRQELAEHMDLSM